MTNYLRGPAYPPDETFPERTYIEPDTLAVVLENPSTTDRVFAQWSWFQSLFGVGVKHVRAVLTGYWMDIEQYKPYTLERDDQVLMIDFPYKVGVKARWPDGTVRVLKAMNNRPQSVYFTKADPTTILHEHRMASGEIYREVATNCKICKRLQFILEEEETEASDATASQ